MHDSWIPSLQPATFSTLEPIPGEATVNFFIDQESKTWNMETVRSFFIGEMAAVIQQIPVSKHGGEDFASWPHARFGIYSEHTIWQGRRSSFPNGAN